MTTSAGLPSWRLLTTLTLLVMAAHVMLLQAAPAQLGATRPSHAGPARAFSTRSIALQALAEPVAARPAKPEAAPPARVTAPKNKPVSTAAQVNQAPLAIDVVAPEIAPSPAESPSSNQTRTAVVAEVAEPAAIRTETPAAAGPQTTAVTAVSLPGSVLLQYKVHGTSKGLNYQANAELAWHNEGSRYDATMKVSALFIGSRSMTSVGQIGTAGLAPTRFADKFKSELAAHFQADQGKITFSANTPDAKWIEGAQDRVSVFLQLGGMLAARPGDFPAGSSITLYTAGPRDADTWTFNIESEEILQLPAGTLNTLKLTRKPRREYDQTVEIWYAPSLGFVPVRNRITQQNGDFIDQQLTQALRP